MRVISVRACFTRISTRAILMPAPVEPALVAMPESRIMNSGANTGHCV